MDRDELLERLSIVSRNGSFRVTARESTDLEFKRDLTLATFRKSLKTISAFSNKSGGWIVFGVRDNPRDLVGIEQNRIDEGVQSEQMSQALCPIPTTHFFEFEVHGMHVGVLLVEPLGKPPSVAIRDIAGPEGGGQILSKGMIYTRRRGQTTPITGEEFSQLLSSRDERTRQEIFSYLNRGRDIGFERAVVADVQKSHDVPGETEMIFYLPASAAKDLAIVDRARLVEDNGAPAYELRGNVTLTVPNDQDPRLPRRASDSAEQMREEIVRPFWPTFPWSHSHLKKAAAHLGFWKVDTGDNVHTGREPLTSTTLYYDAGRSAVINLASQNPDDFVEIVGSASTIAEWRRRNAMLENE